MLEAKPEERVLRRGRQVTLPAGICAALGLEAGDRLEITVVGDGILLRSKKRAALRMLNEIREGFVASGISEEELLVEGRRVREELSRQ